MGRPGWRRDPDLTEHLCTIRKPLFWHTDLVPSALLKVDYDKSNNDSERLSFDDSERSDDVSP